MFGRKRKKEQEGLGLPGDEGSGLSGLGSTSASVSGLGSTSASVSVSNDPLPPPAPEPAGTASPAGADTAANPLAQLSTLGLGGASSGKMLAEILSGHGPVGELVKQIRADPMAFRQRMIEQAQAAGTSAFVVTPQGMTPIGHPPGVPVPTHVDVIDELTKAADLHEKGALTDAEFEQLKHKLLAH
jgi:Short C-terminal domain